MKKSILGVSFMSTILAVLISVSVNASASDVLTVSDPLVEKIKGYEGFSAYAVKDSSQYSIGYGTACDPSNYPNGITEAEAEVLLREHIATAENSVNNFTTKYDIVLEQQQFDAMVSMTYNLGPSWLNAKYKVWQYLISGDYTAEEMASAMVAWNKAGNTVLEGLIIRRIDEAEMFLFADYNGSSGKTLTRVYYNANGGSKSNDLTLHVTGDALGVMATAERDGYYFAGWYNTDGTLVDSTTVVTATLHLEARWSTTEVDLTVEEEVVAPAVTQVSTGTFSDVVDNAWYAPYINELAEDGVFGGYEDGTFQPTRIVTLGEALKIVLIGAGYEPQEAVEEHWASGYFYFAGEQGFLKDMTIDTLDTAVSRSNVAVLVSNIVEMPEVYEMDVFEDTNTNAANGLYALGIFNGSLEDDGNRYFYPEQAISRAELAKIVAMIRDL